MSRDTNMSNNGNSSKEPSAQERTSASSRSISVVIHNLFTRSVQPELRTELHTDTPALQLLNQIIRDARILRSLISFFTVLTLTFITNSAKTALRCKSLRNGVRETNSNNTIRNLQIHKHALAPIVNASISRRIKVNLSYVNRASATSIQFSLLVKLPNYR